MIIQFDLLNNWPHKDSSSLHLAVELQHGLFLKSAYLHQIGMRLACKNIHGNWNRKIHTEAVQTVANAVQNLQNF